MVLGICSLAIISNAVLYSYWSGPLDYNALKYLETPAEAAASINWWLMILPIGVGFALFFAFRYLFIRLHLTPFYQSRSSSILEFATLLLFAGICIIPIRGGIGMVPVNLSFVYFHKDIYPNHAAYNPVWNVLYSWAESSKENDYTFMDTQLANEKFAELYKIPQTGESEKWITQAQPNVIVIVLESFLSKLVGLNYKGEEVTPHLNRLTKQGIYFSNLYASGDRSDKGLGSIFSGFPAMPKSALVQYPDKMAKVPSIFKDMAKADYTTSFYYGGSLDFANLRSYFISAQVQNIVTGEDVPKTRSRGKWGVHDKPMFDKFYNDLMTMKEPFFANLFTLSNHEPFDLPEENHFGKANGDEEYMSASWYTDKYLGQFMEALRRLKLWENTLVVIVSDHGTARLGIKEVYDPEKYHIPMVWTGGVIKTPKMFDKVCSQTDIPLLILNQCCIKPTQVYTYSNEIDRAGSKPFAAYLFNDGVGFVGPDCISIYENVSGKFKNGEQCPGNLNGEFGKAYLQVLSKDFTK